MKFEKNAQKNHSTIKIVLRISNFQDDLLNQEFFFRVDCKSAKDIFRST